MIPPSPSVASAQTAAEAVEHYWGALLRDVPFTHYATNSLAAQAVEDMNELSYINSNANNEYPAPVTMQNLFRGQVYPGDGNVMGLIFRNSWSSRPRSECSQSLNCYKRFFR